MNFSNEACRNCSGGSSCHHSEDEMRGYRRRVSETGGFTLVELIVIVAILGLLALMSLPLYNEYITLSKIHRTEADIRTIEKDIQAYYIDHGAYPPDTDLSAIGRDNLRDPWGNPYQYRFPAALTYTVGVQKMNADFDIYSKGPDGNSDADGSVLSCKDDIVRASDGGYVGERP